MGNTHIVKTKISFVINKDYTGKNFDYASRTGVIKALNTMLKGFDIFSSEDNKVIIQTYDEKTARLLKKNQRYFLLLANFYLFGWEGYKDEDFVAPEKGINLENIEKSLDKISMKYFGTRNYPITQVSFENL